MSRGSAAIDGLAGIDIGRRDALKALAGGGLAIGTAGAVDNVFVGYGILTGTNLLEQDLAARAGERLEPSSFTVPVGDGTIGYRDGAILASGAGGDEVRVDIGSTSADGATALDSELGLDGAVTALREDLGAIRSGSYRFSFEQYPDFLDRVTAGETRPLAVAALRGNRFETPEPTTIRRFVDGDPADTRTVIEGLAWGFRHYTGYDIDRYVAGSIQDNVLLGAGNLRRGFRSPTGFTAIMEGENTGLFCYEFTYRSIEAFHAVPPREQTVPVAGAVVTDARHKHVYTGLASAIREDGDLVLPMTFLDYTHSTLYDDLNMRGVLGEGVAAYDARHRTTDIFWNEYARWA